MTLKLDVGSTGINSCGPLQASTLMLDAARALDGITHTDNLNHRLNLNTKCKHLKQTMFNLLSPANEVWGKVMFLHMCVILFTGGWLPSMHHMSHVQGVCIVGVWIQGDQTHKSAYRRGWADPPLPKIHGILWDTVNKRAVRILLECILVFMMWMTLSFIPEPLKKNLTRNDRTFPMMPIGTKIGK